MDRGATEHEILEKKVEKRLQDPKTEPLISLTLDFLEEITCGFSTERVLGEGLSGVVYKGVLRSGKAIAVKKIRDEHLLGNQVENEIICLTKVRHQNVVQLVGYCVQTKSEVTEHSGKHVMVEKRACLLCFEFLCNGSLDEHLSDDILGLDWDIRYEIIRGVCRGLHYLHNECHIVHLDLKPQNILMDSTMMPKIADFGLSRLLGEQKYKIVTKNLAGTTGYMAKEYIDKGIISPKADIFSLGVIITEIITGRRDYPNINERTETSNSISERTETSLKHFTEEVVGYWRKRLEITPMHMSPEIHIQQVEQCISIALKCLDPESKKRPTSLEIVQGLDALEPESGSPGNSPSDPEKDMRNQNLESQVPKTNSAIKSLNECANLFQWVISATSSLKCQWSGTQWEKLQGDVQKLQSDHQYLSDSLPRIHDLIDQAEWRAHANKYVADLLPKLKDAVYDAEDLLDDFRWYETKVSVEGNAISVKPVIEFFSGVTQGGFNKVTDIQNRLNHLSRELEKVGSLQPIPRFGKSFRPETTSFCNEEKIFGRDKEKDDLIRLLGVPTKDSTDASGSKRKRSGKFFHDKENKKLIRLPGVPTKNSTDPSGSKRKRSGVPVLPIVGIGGVGKTTLAQDICNHSKVKRQFDLIIWICVSEDFNVKRLTKEAIEQSTGKVPEKDNLSSLQGTLANSLDSKRFLLVLDDMWDENEWDWKQFCAPFRDVAADGSMMLVTTRSPKVADVVRTMDPVPLEGLNDDVFRKFFKLCVFGSDSSNNYPELERIGEKILPKLKGSPLAAKTLGRLLRTKLDPLHWKGILNSELWEHRQEETDILPALRLSYMYLPVYLKRCFSFCAVYPKDYIFKKGDLSEIWVAEGLVEHKPNIPLHHVGGQYFEELAHLSFFQKYPRSQEKYVIHDLMHDMAQLVSKDECFIVKDTKDLPKIPKNVRHLFVLKGGDVKCSDLLNLCKHRKLRTLLCDLSLKSKTGNTVMEKWCDQLLCMRVMVCFSISKWGLPHSISNMNHLRYLKIQDSCFCQSLTAAFCRLYNMQILYAKKWNIDEIPSGFGMLINLQKFESVKYKFQHMDIDEGATDRRQKRLVKFTSYSGESLPSWFLPQNSEQIYSYDSTDSTFSSPIDVKILDCQNLSSLVQFLQPAILHTLEVLSVHNCPKIESRRLFAPSLERLFLENSGNLGYDVECSSLTILHLSDYPLESIQLQMWNLPLLQKLKISSCPSLTVITGDSEHISTYLSHGGARSKMGKFPKLTYLTIMDCEKLETIDDLLHLPAIERIWIEKCGLLSLPANRLGSFPRLKDLEISWCGSLDWQSGMLLPPSLQNLRLWSCGGDISAWFPSCLEKLTSLESLDISNCECLVSVSGHLWSSNLKSLERLKLNGIQKLKSVGGPHAIAHIKHLLINRCPELKEIDQPLRKGI